MAVLVQPWRACSHPVASQHPESQESGLCRHAPGKSLGSPFTLNVCSSVLQFQGADGVCAAVGAVTAPTDERDLLQAAHLWQEPSSGCVGPGFSAAWMRKGEEKEDVKCLHEN